jgi:putative transposase
MPRQARIDAPGALHHIIARGMERREIFYDKRDRDDFLHRLGKIVTESQTRCYAWALIPNHFHLKIQWFIWRHSSRIPSVLSSHNPIHG